MFPLALAALTFATPAHADPLVVYVVRHAEKGKEPAADPGLTPDGVARADALARLLTDVTLTGVHSTAWARTRSTATPAADAHGLAVKAYDPVDALVAGLKAEGGVHLVVGHSNTAPAIVEALGAGAQPPMAETEFDRLVLVVVPEQGPAVAQTLRYGAVAK